MTLLELRQHIRIYSGFQMNERFLPRLNGSITSARSPFKDRAGVRVLAVLMLYSSNEDQSFYGECLLVPFALGPPDRIGLRGSGGPFFATE
jgi:hypothetical protein